MKCPNCHQELADNCLFCTSCGMKIDPEASAPQTPDQTENIAVQNFSDIENVQNDQPSAGNTIQQQPNFTAQQPNSKSNICKICGGTVDPKTKVCTTCGKQYFKISVTLISLIAVSVIALILAVFSVTKISALNKTIDSQESTIQTLNNELDTYQDKIDFMDQYVVIEIEGDNTYYHKYGCPSIKGKTFWIFNISAAKSQGYIADPACN